VREDVPPYTVVAGRPAKVVKEIPRPESAGSASQDVQGESP